MGGLRESGCNWAKQGDWSQRRDMLSILFQARIEPRKPLDLRLQVCWNLRSLRLSEDVDEHSKGNHRTCPFQEVLLEGVWLWSLQVSPSTDVLDRFQRPEFEVWSHRIREAKWRLHGLRNQGFQRRQGGQHRQDSVYHRAQTQQVHFLLRPWESIWHANRRHFRFTIAYQNTLQRR